MRNMIDFSSWQTTLSALLGLIVVTLVMVGIRLIIMQSVQQRRERENRQINERLRTLIAAYKTLGGSFTGDLAVDPTHLRDFHVRAAKSLPIETESALDAVTSTAAIEVGPSETTASDRRRRVRDAVEAALSDVILLGTEEQVRLAVKAANDLAAGRAVETAEIVVSLRTFIRGVLDLDPVPSELSMPKQGPVRPVTSGSRGAGRGALSSGRGGAAGGRGEGDGGSGMGVSGRDALDTDGGAHR